MVVELVEDWVGPLKGGKGFFSLFLQLTYNYRSRTSQRMFEENTPQRLYYSWF